MTVKKWETWTADLNPRMGTEPGKTRPVVIIQTNMLNSIPHPSTLVCPITTQVTPEAEILRVHIKSREAGLEKASDILVDQLRAIDNRRLKMKIGSLGLPTKIKLQEALRVILDF